MPIRPEMRGRYPRDWKLRSKFVRFYRARNCCEWCHVPNGVWRNVKTGEWTRNPEQVDAWALDGEKASRVVLTVAHVHDDRPEACSLDNLAALCQRCHNRHDGKARQLGRRARAEQASGQLQLSLSGQLIQWPDNVLSGSGEREKHHG